MTLKPDNMTEKTLIDDHGPYYNIDLHNHRGEHITIKNRPTGATYHYLGKVYNTLPEATQAVDDLYGPVVADKAIEEIEWDHDLPGTLTQHQIRRVKQLARAILRHDGLGLEHIANYEYKQFKLDGWSNRIFLRTTVGRKGDENTLAHSLCRTHRHIVIGPRGGLRSLIGPKSKSTGWSNVLYNGYEH